jgi:hypothetical protein
MSDKQFVEFIIVVRQMAESLHHIALKVDSMSKDTDDFRMLLREISESIQDARKVADEIT